MTRLEELEEELYGKDEEELGRRMRRRIVFPGTLRKPPTSWLGRFSPLRTAGAQKPGTLLRILWGAMAVIFIIGGAVFLFFYLGSKGQEAQVTIQGRDKVESGEVVTIPVVFKNISKSVLQEVELAIIIPEGSLLLDGVRERPVPPRIVSKINDLEPGQEQSSEVTVRLFGREGEEKTVEAVLLYRPANLRARFSARSQKLFIINRVPLAISWDTPKTFSRGQEVEIGVRYNSSATLPFEDVSLRLEYPPGFLFKLSDPKPEMGDALWSIGKVAPGGEGKIIVRGTVSGEEGEIKTFRAALGVFNLLTKEWRPYSESSTDVEIALTPLSVQMFLEGMREKVIVPGEALHFTVRYKNNTSAALKNITINVSLAGSIIDLGSLSIGSGGVFDAQSNKIIWGPGGTSKLRELEPGEEGELSFDVQTRERPIVRGDQDKNLIVEARSSIQTATVPREFEGTKVGSAYVQEFKVRSKVIFVNRAFYRASPLASSGPLPPRVGAKTAYALLWEVRNFTNDLQGVEVRVTLPPNIKWENVFSPKDSHIFYDAASSEVRWKIGTVLAGTGVLNPALLGVFQVSVTPSEVDAGKIINLASGSVFVGRDTFTGEEIKIETGSLTTELREDPTTTAKDWSVVR